MNWMGFWEKAPFMPVRIIYETVEKPQKSGFGASKWLILLYANLEKMQKLGLFDSLYHSEHNAC